MSLLGSSYTNHRPTTTGKERRERGRKKTLSNQLLLSPRYNLYTMARLFKSSTMMMLAAVSLLMSNVVMAEDKPMRRLQVQKEGRQHDDVKREMHSKKKRSTLLNFNKGVRRGEEREGDGE